MAQYDVDLREYWRILKKRKFTVIITSVVLGILSTIFAIIKAPVPVYTSGASIKFEKNTGGGVYGQPLALFARDDIATQIFVIRSDAVMERVARKLGRPSNKSRSDKASLHPDANAMVQAFKAKVQVTREGLTKIIHIRATDTDPRRAQKLANTTALAYKEVRTEEQNRRTTEAATYIAEQLKTARKNLTESEKAFNQFTQQNQLLSVNLESENLLLRAREIKDEIRKHDETKGEFEALIFKLQQFIEKPTGSAHRFHSDHAGEQYQTANDELVGLLLKRDSLLEDYTPRHPEVVTLDRQVVENARKMLILSQLRLDGINQKREALKREQSNEDRVASSLMNKKLEFSRLKRKVDSYGEMTALLERKHQEALIRKVDRPDEVTIVSPAFFPVFPMNPPRTSAKAGIGFVIGFILGVLIALVAETFDTSLGAIEDVEEAIKTQVLSVIPHWDTKDFEENLGDNGDGSPSTSSFSRSLHLVSHFAFQSVLAESFRTLRTYIRFHNAEKNLKTLAVTSASPGEGKSAIAANVAITMAQAGMKTLLVDCDLRKPVVAKTFGLDVEPGLTDVLIGSCAWHDVVRTIADIMVGNMTPDEAMITPGLDNLHIVTSGKTAPNSMALIESQRLTDIIEEAKEEYDALIFDTQPVLASADATILGTKMDAVLLVYRVGSVSRGILKRAAVQLSQMKCNLMGVVLNGMKSAVSPDFQGFKYYNYYYNSEEEGKGKGRRRDSFWHFAKGKLSETAIEEAGRLSQVDNSPEKLSQILPSRRMGVREYLASFFALVILLIGLQWHNGTLPFNKQEPDSTSASLERNKEAQTSDKITKPISTGEALFTSAEASSPPKKEEKKKEKANEGQSPEVTKIKYPYSIHTGSFKKPESVQRAVSALKAKGLAPFSSKVDLGEKGAFVRVFVGHFGDREEAARFKDEHGLADGLVSKTPYAVRLRNGSSLEDLHGAKGRLTKMGYYPYALDNLPNTQSVLVGAYDSEASARVQSEELNGAGIQCTVVLR